METDSHGRDDGFEKINNLLGRAPDALERTIAEVMAVALRVEGAPPTTSAIQDIRIQRTPDTEGQWVLLLGPNVSGACSLYRNQVCPPTMTDVD